MSKTKDTDEFIVPSSQADRKKINDSLREISGALQFIADKRSFIKDVVDNLHSEYKMPKKLSNKLAKTMFNHDYNDIQHESGLFELVYESIIEPSKQPSDSE